MFDVNTPIDIKIPSPTGDKNVTVRFPTDEELVLRALKQKTVLRPIGRGKTVSETLNADDVNAELLRKIAQDGSAELDEFESTHVITELTRCDVIDSERSSTGFTVTVSVPGAETTHHLRMPSMKQVFQYRRNVVSVTEGRRGAQEVKLHLNVAGELYDQLAEAPAEGYQGPVPIVHKAAVVSEALALLDELKDNSEVAKGFK